MIKLKKGDIVSRFSYGNDIMFYIVDFIRLIDNKIIVILKGLFIRIIVSAPIDDLKKENIRNINYINNKISLQNEKIINSILKSDCYDIRNFKYVVKPRILHIDGDRKYAERSYKIYEKFKLNFVVKNIKESNQPYEIEGLLNRFKPSIVIVTGHDGMIQKGKNFYNIYNYRNSKYFVKTVQLIRRWEKKEQIAIFAGACQSYYEELIKAGANFASSPARIIIDFMDPIIIAKKIANTCLNEYVSIDSVKYNLKNGENGIGGIGCYGKLIKL